MLLSLLDASFSAQPVSQPFICKPRCLFIEEQLISLVHPAQDLINTIDHFAAKHYTERGQLRPKWPIPPKKASEPPPPSSTISTALKASTSQRDLEDDDFEEDRNTPNIGISALLSTPNTIVDPNTSDEPVRHSSINMHRAFDDAAANALGEHIPSHLIQPHRLPLN